MQEFSIKKDIKLIDANGRNVIIKSINGEVKVFADTKPVLRIIKSFRTQEVASQWMKIKNLPGARIVKSFDGFEILGDAPMPGFPSHVVIEEQDMSSVIESISSVDVDEMFGAMLKKGLLEISEYGDFSVTNKFHDLKTDFIKRAIKGNVKKSITDLKIDDDETESIQSFIVKSEVAKAKMTQGQADNIGQSNTAISDSEAEALESEEPKTVTGKDPAPKVAMSQGEADNIGQSNESIKKAIDATSQVAQSLENQDLQKSADTKSENPCWEGFTQLGMKEKGGKKVPNCVPSKEVHKGFVVFKSHNDAINYARINGLSKKDTVVRALHLREKQAVENAFNFVVESKVK